MHEITKSRVISASISNMNTQFIILIFSAFLVFSMEACNTAQDRQICATLTQRCRETAASRPISSPDDSLGAFNAQCRQSVGASWRNVPFCDMVRAVCELAVIRCQLVTCRNVQALFQ